MGTTRTTKVNNQITVTTARSTTFNNLPKFKTQINNNILKNALPSSSFKFSCASSPCHSSATCSDTSSGYTCSCQEGEGGDAYGSGCKDKDIANYEDIAVLFGLL